jgi:hypothetical protein
MMTNDPRHLCPKCDGKRIFNGKKCTVCWGNGFIPTLVDSDDDDDDEPSKPRRGDRPSRRSDKS